MKTPDRLRHGGSNRAGDGNEGTHKKHQENQPNGHTLAQPPLPRFHPSHPDQGRRPRAATAKKPPSPCPPPDPRRRRPAHQRRHHRVMGRRGGSRRGLRRVATATPNRLDVAVRRTVLCGAWLAKRSSSSCAGVWWFLPCSRSCGPIDTATSCVNRLPAKGFRL